jgi:hypothetical protein
MMPFIEDCGCIAVPFKVRSKTEGVGGLSEFYKTTIKRFIEDDNGLSHGMLLPESYNISAAPSRILCPQHRPRSPKTKRQLPEKETLATEMYVDR